MNIPQEESKSQWERLLDHLIVNGSATSLEIINDLYIMNYKGRVCDLRKKGYTIFTEEHCEVDGVKQQYARYHLRGFPQ